MFDFVIKNSDILSGMKAVCFEKVIPADVTFSADYVQIGNTELWFAGHQSEQERHFYRHNDQIVIHVGHVMLNEEGIQQIGSSPELLSSKDIFELVKAHPKDYLRYIKGVFIIVMLQTTSERQNSFQIVNSMSSLYDLYYTRMEGSFFAASTSIRLLEQIMPEPPVVNPISMIEHSIFDYPLGETTYYKNIQWLKQANILDFSHNQLTFTTYADFLPLLKQNHSYAWKGLNQEIYECFNKIVDQMLDASPTWNIALTSGFDSRTVLARILNKPRTGIKLYSWGLAGSLDVEIPTTVAQRFGLDHERILLDDSYLKQYEQRASSAVLCSDGRATIRRANHMYAYAKLSKHSHYNITGLFGSELLRPVSAIGHTFNQNYYDIVTADNTGEAIDKVLEKEQTNGFIKATCLTAYRDDVKQHILEEIQETFQGLPKYLGLYYFHLKEGFRRYFGHEIHTTRYYVNTFSPYIDDDFVHFLLKSPVPHLNKLALDNSLKKDVWNTRRGQLFYLPIIRRNYPSLMHLNTGRMYTPAQLGSIFYPLSILPGLIKKRFTSTNGATFRSEEWIRIFIKQHTELLTYESDIFQTLPVYQVSSFSNYAKQLSLRYWINHIKG